MNKYTEAALRTDALHLGSHWIYDTTQLAQEFPDGVTELRDPLSPYHPNRKAGQYTHIGDQTRFLGECLEAHGGYDFTLWKAYWLGKMASYDGYLDGATKKTLETQAETPSDSAEISGVCRMVPLLDLGLSLEETIQAAQSQASLSHGDPVIAEAAEFFVRAVYAVQGGMSIPEALKVSAESGNYVSLAVSAELAKAAAADKEDYATVAGEFGQGCTMPGAFPLTLYYALNFCENFQQMLNANALGGGDNTARGILLSALITAQEGQNVGSSSVGH